MKVVLLLALYFALLLGEAPCSAKKDCIEIGGDCTFDRDCCNENILGQQERCEDNKCVEKSCAGRGEECSSSNNCCRPDTCLLKKIKGTFETRGTCEEDVGCLRPGEICGSGIFCCSGICLEGGPDELFRGECAPCSFLGESCTEDNDCCDTSFISFREPRAQCLDGTCANPCIERGGDCTRIRDCCGGYLERCIKDPENAFGTCRDCINRDEPDAQCFEDSDCCGRDVCKEGKCDPVGCINAGDFGCITDKDCCQSGGTPREICYKAPTDDFGTCRKCIQRNQPDRQCFEDKDCCGQDVCQGGKCEPVGCLNIDVVGCIKDNDCCQSGGAPNEVCLKRPTDGFGTCSACIQRNEPRECFADKDCCGEDDCRGGVCELDGCLNIDESGCTKDNDCCQSGGPPKEVCLKAPYDGFGTCYACITRDEFLRRCFEDKDCCGEDVCRGGFCEPVGCLEVGLAGCYKDNHCCQSGGPKKEICLQDPNADFGTCLKCIGLKQNVLCYEDKDCCGEYVCIDGVCNRKGCARASVFSFCNIFADFKCCDAVFPDGDGGLVRTCRDCEFGRCVGVRCAFEN